ncbi:TT1751-like protein [Daedaleopsis nitida]|nr:TT1751-like protein [Daedaleopsis nitida]
MSSKTVVNFTARRVSYETPLPLTEVIARLDKEINKAGGGPEVFRLLRTAKDKAELEEGFNALTQGRDFVHFLDNPYHRWMNAYTGNASTPATYVYMLGNPLIAQGMLRHDVVGALHIPPRILVSEKPDGSGTRVVYDDPASVIAVPGSEGGSVDEELKSAAEGLSQKLEHLVQTVVRV